MQPIKVLIVEDQNIIARDIETLLTDWGYIVVGCASSGEEALFLFKKHQPDLALVDIHIVGEMDGIDTVIQFNEIRMIPIVYLTAQADTYTVNKAKASKPSAYLLKPFDERGLQISLEMAFNTFSHTQAPPQYITEKKEENNKLQAAKDIKLGADVILQIDEAIFIKQNYRFVKLNKAEIVLLEADRNHTYIQTKQHRHIVRMPLTTVFERLLYDKMVRVHRSYAVNTLHIDEFNDSQIIANGKTLPFSSAYKDDFFNKFYTV